MNESAHDTALKAFDQIVTPYLRKKLGQQIAATLTEAIQPKVLLKNSSADDAFAILYKELFKVKLDGYDGPFLSLVLEDDELTSLPDSFERDYASLQSEDQEVLTARNAFSLLLAPDLKDVLGAELVTHLNTLYVESMELQVGVSDHIRFFVAMGQLMEIVSLLNEVEYLEKIKKIAAKLRKDKNTPSELAVKGSSSSITLQDGIIEIIIPDLAGVLGEGPVLESLLLAIHNECTGFFPDEIARFSYFVNKLIDSDIILDMFGDHWTSGKQNEWVEDFKKLMQA